MARAKPQRSFAHQFVSVIKRKTHAAWSSAFRRCILECKHSTERRLKAELQTLNELAGKAPQRRQGQGTEMNSVREA